MKKLSKSVLLSIVVLTPPFKEQERVAGTLNLVDSNILTTKKLIRDTLQRRKALMQRLLTGKSRFREFVKDDSFQPSNFGNIPTDWACFHIGDIAHEVSKRNTDGAQLTVLSCTKHRGLVDSLSYFGKRIFSKDTSTYKLVRRGQFAYATNHIEEGSIGYQDLYDEALISPMYTVFETIGPVNDLFLYKLLKTELYRHIFEVNTSASVDRRGSLRWKGFANIKIALPSLEEQSRIATVLNDCDKEVELLKRQLDALIRQKRGLMQKLLTGQIRVKVEDEIK
jgi:type I restriction enzyme S subunit